MLSVGGGLSLDGRLREIKLWVSPEGPVELGGDTVMGGLFAMEILIGRDPGDHFALKGGATFDFNDDNSVFNPVVLGSVSF